MPVAEGARPLLPSGQDRWTVEARRVLLLASELDERVDDDVMLTYDMRDLLALSATLRARLVGPAIGHETAGWQRYLRAWWHRSRRGRWQLPRSGC